MCNISSDVFAVRRVEPDDVSFALWIAILRASFLFIRKVEFDVVVTARKNIFIKRSIALNDFSSEHNADKRSLIDFGSCLIMLGGWLDRESI